MTDVRAGAGVVAELLGRLPARLVRKLEAAPGLGEEWDRRREGGALVVEAGEGATVRIEPADDVVTSVAQVSCTCLLSPACLHVAAVMRSLPLDDGPAAREGRPPETGVPDGPLGQWVALDRAQLAAVERSSAAASRLLATGASSAGLVVEAELLRAAQACRAAGLPRLASALLRAIQRLRDLHGERSDFKLGALVGDVADAAITTARLARQPARASVDDIGRSRRAYEVVGNLKLTGLCCEPVVSAAGYSGVVTYLLSGDGRCWTVSSVTPGGVSDVAAAYTGPAVIGGASLSHRALATSGLHVSGATASADGRLGSGRSVTAVARASEGWAAPEVDARFRLSLGDQLARPVTGDLLFVEAVVAGADDDALVLLLEGDAAPVRAIAPVEHAELPGLDNLRLLAAAPGLSVRAIGRVEPDRPRTIRLLAISSGALALPAAWNGRVNLGLDRLQRGHVPSARDHPHLVTAAVRNELDPLDPFRRRLHRVVYGGRSTCGPLARSGMAQDARKLSNANLRTASSLVHAMAEAAGDRQRFAHVWAGAAVYELACSEHLRRGRWLGAGGA